MNIHCDGDNFNAVRCTIVGNPLVNIKDQLGICFKSDRQKQKRSLAQLSETEKKTLLTKPKA